MVNYSLLIFKRKKYYCERNAQNEQNSKTDQTENIGLIK